MRKQQAPIIPEQKSETDTTNFVRMSGKINQKDKESPFGYIPDDPKKCPNIVTFSFKKFFILTSPNSKSRRICSKQLQINLICLTMLLSILII